VEPEPEAREDVARQTFERDAGAAGLTLPAAHRANPWVVAGVLVVVVVASLAIGRSTDWGLGPRSGPPSAQVFGPQQCTSAPSFLSVWLNGSVDPAVGGSTVQALLAWGANFSSWSGGCVHVAANQSEGSGYVPALSERAAVFATTDAPPNSTEVRSLGAPVDLVPTAVVPVAVVYHLPGVGGGLRLNGSTLAGIFNGSIRSWADPAIQALNPGVNLSGLPAVTAVEVGSPSEATLDFTTYLARADPAWNASVGVGAQVRWPVGATETTGDALESYVAATPGAIGFVASGPALPVGLSVASLQDAAGGFVLPGPEGATSAAAGVANGSAASSHDWANVTLVNAPGAGAYPVCGLLYVAVYHDLGTAYAGSLSPTNGTWLLSFLWWILTDGQNTTGAEGLGPLPASFALLGQQVLEGVQYNGASLLEPGEGGEGGETGEF